MDGVDACRCYCLSIGRDPCRIQQPALTVPCPESSEKSTLRVKRPRAEFFSGGIPANALNSIHRLAIPGLHGETTQKEVTISRPVTVGVHDRIIILVDPVTDHPVQLFELFFSFGRTGRHVFERIDSPLSVFLQCV